MGWMKVMLLFTIFFLLLFSFTIIVTCAQCPRTLKQYVKKITRLLARDSRERLKIVGDYRRAGGVEAGGTVGDGGGPPGTARVMSHDFNLAGIVLEVQALGL